MSDDLECENCMNAIPAGQTYIHDDASGTDWCPPCYVNQRPRGDYWTVVNWPAGGEAL